MLRRERVTAVSRWQEPIDLCPGRLPYVSANPSGDVTYELVIPSGVMTSGFFVAHGRTRLSIRCDAQGGVFAAHAQARRPGRSR
jgi:hypothetical protein